MKSSVHALMILSLTSACSPASISGEVGGESVRGPRDAIYESEVADIPLLGTFQTFAIVITDIPDACETVDEFASNVESGCEEQCEDWSRIGNERLGDDSYYALYLFGVVDPARVEGELRLGGTIPAENEFTGTFIEWDTSQIYDQAGCVEWCEAGNEILPSTDSRLSSGSLTLEGYSEDDGRVDGSFDVELGSGSLDGAFRAQECGTLLDLFGG